MQAVASSWPVPLAPDRLMRLRPYFVAVAIERDLVLVELDPEAGLLGHVDVPLGVDLQRLGEIPLEQVAGHNRRIVKDLEVACVGNGRAEVEVGKHPDPAVADVRSDELVVELGQA